MLDRLKSVAGYSFVLLMVAFIGYQLYMLDMLTVLLMIILVVAEMLTIFLITYQTLVSSVGMLRKRGHDDLENTMNRRYAW